MERWRDGVVEWWKDEGKEKRDGWTEGEGGKMIMENEVVQTQRQREDSRENVQRIVGEKSVEGERERGKKRGKKRSTIMYS